VLIRFFGFSFSLSSFLRCIFTGDDLLEFHQAVVSTLRDADDMPMPLDPAPLPPMNSSHTHPHALSHPIIPHSSEDMARISETHTDITEHTDTDEADNGEIKTVCVFVYVYECVCVCQILAFLGALKRSKSIRMFNVFTLEYSRM
jgi:hypothetical protein